MLRCVPNDWRGGLGLIACLCVGLGCHTGTPQRVLTAMSGQPPSDAATPDAATTPGSRNAATSDSPGAGDPAATAGASSGNSSAAPGVSNPPSGDASSGNSHPAPDASNPPSGDPSGDNSPPPPDASNPPVPPPGDAIGDSEIIAGRGFFEGQPFNTLPNPKAAEASLAYSPFGNALGLSLIQLDATNPLTGDNVTLIAGLHASRVERRDGLIIGYVTPGGGLSGPSLFNDGKLNKPVSGTMFLRKIGDEWVVDVYCLYEGGIVLGQARGKL